MTAPTAPRPRVATRDAPGVVAPHYFLYYNGDEPTPPARSATAEIWRDCARRAAIWTAVYAVIAAVGLMLYGLGVLLPYLSMS